MATEAVITLIVVVSFFVTVLTRKLTIDLGSAASITGNQAARFLDEFKEFRPFPKRIVCDNGTEYMSKAMFFRSKESGAKLRFIQSGKPS